MMGDLLTLLAALLAVYAAALVGCWLMERKAEMSMEADKTLQRQCAANRLQQMEGYYPRGSVERLALTMGAEALREAEHLRTENRGLMDALDRAAKESAAKRSCISRERVEKNKAIENLAEIVKSAYQQRDAAIARAAMLQAENEKLMERGEALHETESSCCTHRTRC